MLATLAPAAVAAVRARVWVSDIDVGSRHTAAVRMASATAGGGSLPWRSATGITSSVTSRACRSAPA